MIIKYIRSASVNNTDFLYLVVWNVEEKKLEYLKLLNRNGFGVPLIASFNNGIVSKLVAGKSLDDEILVNKMADKSFAR